MSAINPGDLVIVVKPSACCGSVKVIGVVFQPDEVSPGFGRCGECGTESVGVSAREPASGKWIYTSRLKKIDPPAEGDSLPTRADIKVSAC